MQSMTGLSPSLNYVDPATDSKPRRKVLSEDLSQASANSCSGSRSSSGHGSLETSGSGSITLSPSDPVKNHLTQPEESGFQSESRSPESSSSNLSTQKKTDEKKQDEMVDIDSDQVLAWAFGSQLPKESEHSINMDQILGTKRKVQLAKTPKTSYLLTPGRNRGARALGADEIKALTDQKTLLGEGSFGRVYSVQSEQFQSGRALALKEFKVGCDASDSMKRSALREIHTQIAMNHPNIASAIGFHTGMPMLLVMEKEPYVLSSLLNLYGSYSPQLAAFLRH